MSNPVSIFLLVVFSIHLIVFSGLYFRRKKRHHLLFAVVFFLLVLSQATRLWMPQWNFFGQPVFQACRIAAWIATAVAVLYWMKLKRSK